MSLNSTEINKDPAAEKAAKPDLSLLPYAVLREFCHRDRELLLECCKFLKEKEPKIFQLKNLFPFRTWHSGDCVDAINEITKVRENGISKYGDTIMSYPLQVYKAAFMRHIVAFCCGKNIDESSGLPHLAHARINAFIICGYFGEVK